MSATEQKVGLSADQLKDVLSAVIAEAKKPVITEEQLAAKEDARKTRQENADNYHAMKAGEAARQRNCTHKHQNQSTGAVPYKNGRNEVEFVLCQLCRVVVKPFMPDANGMPTNKPGNGTVKDDVTYDINLFNRLMVDVNSRPY